MASNTVIDFTEYGLDIKDTCDVKSETIKALGKEIVDMLRKYNFCYLSDHGVSAKLMENYMKSSRQFFDLPPEEKSKYFINRGYTFGWSALEATHADLHRIAGDLHEAFNYTPTYDTAWPPVETFESLSKEVYTTGEALALRICDALSLGLGLPIDHLRNAHKLVGQKGNSSCTRTNYYPPIPTGKIVPNDQARISDHVDYGTFSLDFQDQVGGLEVETPGGGFVPVDPIPGTVVLLGGTSMKSCSLGVLSGAKHRVPVPTDDRRFKQRRSLVFFLLPDDDFVVSPSTDSYGQTGQTQTQRAAWEKYIHEGLYQPKE